MSSRYGLVFYPRALDYQPKSINQFLARLQSGGFIGSFFQSNGRSGYLIGDDFLKQVTFLGCAPHIEVSPPEQMAAWGNFCYIEIRQFQSPHYFQGLNHLKCSCPYCQSRVVKALPDMAQWAANSQPVICPKCQQASLIENLNWRHGAGFGQFFIVVNSIYPNEAVPTDNLMAILYSACDVSWDYFYFEQ